MELDGVIFPCPRMLWAVEKHAKNIIMVPVFRKDLYDLKKIEES